MNYTYILQVQIRRGEYPATIGCATYKEARELAEWAHANPEHRSHVIAKIERPEDFPGIFLPRNAEKRPPPGEG